MKRRTLARNKTPARLLRMGKWCSDKCTALDLGVTPSVLSGASAWLVRNGFATGRKLPRGPSDSGQMASEFTALSGADL
jgi:hypothetical protein